MEGKSEENSTSIIESDAQPIIDVLQEASSAREEFIGRFLQTFIN